MMSMHPKFLGPWLRVIAGMMAGALLLSLLSIWEYGFFAKPTAALHDQVEIYIPAGSGLKGIQQILADSGLLKKDLRFRLLARLMGKANRLRAGEYLIARGTPPFQVLQILAAGRTIQRSLTIPEGANIFQVADLMAAQKLAEPKSFLKVCRDRSFISTLGIEADSLEGYLFPDTYIFERGTPIKDMVRVMVRRGDAVWQELTSATGPLAMTRHQILTLASIVEKETADPDERPLIARVFLERLKRNMLLQTDPTVIYGLDEYSGRLHRKDLEEDHPYNTYLHKGLPPGPIANPGRSALESVLHPASEVFLYFVSKNDGTHYFSKTLKEHNRAVRRFQKKDSGKLKAESQK